MSERNIWVDREDRLLLLKAIDEVKSASGLLMGIDMRGYGGAANADTKAALLDLRSVLRDTKDAMQTLIDETEKARLAAFRKDEI